MPIGGRFRLGPDEEHLTDHPFRFKTIPVMALTSLLAAAACSGADGVTRLPLAEYIDHADAICTTYYQQASEDQLGADEVADLLGEMHVEIKTARPESDELTAESERLFDEQVRLVGRLADVMGAGGSSGDPEFDSLATALNVDLADEFREFGFGVCDG